jgi:hypothetical protein
MNLAMKAIGSAMRGIYLLIKPANVAAQKRRLVLHKSVNIRQ